ncbi:MAG: 8-amino-7-oxononanoate synthase [Candidatus Gastranaerophilales bacterium]|nr:8-amino-7-oxononanoate synthase [Candidatus Gastranaerophilales bacterium]
MQNYILELENLKENSHYRTIKDIKEKISKYIIAEDKKMLNLSSNDYLNLSCDKDLTLEFIEKHKNHSEFLFSSASARLLTGNSRQYFALEEKIAKLFKKEKALLFNTGYQCNQGVVSSLFGAGDCIISDKLNHASIVSGLKLSRAEHFRYKHLDYDNLENILKTKRNNYKNAVIISESVFSMDGDIADIKKLIELKKKYNCLLMLDEAHAFGVFGDNLTGASPYNLLDDIDIITITLGKALASLGALCISNSIIINYLINKASSFIFSTAIPSVNVMWTNFLLEEKFDLLKQKKEKLNNLFNKVHKLYPTVSSSQIIPIVLKDAQKTLDMAKLLQNDGYYVLPINPPTVPVNSSRLRVSLCSDIEYSEIEGLIKRVKNEL